MDNRIYIYTDGACRGNPGPGGWGAVLYIDNKAQCLKGALADTTNNQMELMAPIKALENLPVNSRVRLFTDSKYVKNGIESWIFNWKRKGWKTSAGKPVKNKELWMALDQQVNRHQVQWSWVKGHSGNTGNELADQLACDAIDEMLATN